MNNKNLVLISGACLFTEEKGRLNWFLVRQSDQEEWELPKVLVRKGESSVRAILRVMGEKGGMMTKVLEEAGRAGGSATVNGRNIPQRFIYYLMNAMNVRSSSSEPIGFPEYSWMEFAQAAKKLFSKRERLMLKQAKGELSRWQKKYQKKRQQ